MSTKIVNTTCVLDCPDTCSLEIVVDDDKIKSIRGAQDDPVTQGFICSKVSRFSKRIYHDDRLLYPMRRRGEKGAADFEPISWEEAVSEITNRYRDIILRWGGEAILPYHYGGSNGLISEEFLDDFYFAKLGASRLAKTICAAPTTEVALGMYGKMPGVAFEDYQLAKLILIWGANPKASNIHLVPFLQQAKKNGAFVAVVDPTRNFSSSEIDLHLPAFPGADLPLALSMIRLWNENNQLDLNFLNRHADGLEALLRKADEWPVARAAKEACVEAKVIRTLAQIYAESAPAVLRCGWGLERNRNGGQAVATILAMPALLGKFGVRGGGYTMSNSGAAKFDSRKIFAKLDWQTRVINMTQLGSALHDSLNPPIKGLFVYNCNPAVTVPDQNAVLSGLKREDLFTVVFEQVMTDTAKYADVILPATTFLEHHDIRRSYGNFVVGGVKPAIPARGEAKSNEVVFAMLGRAMGWKDEPFFWDTQTCMQMTSAALDLYGNTADEAILRSGKSHRFDFPEPTPIQFKSVFPQTPDAIIHLAPSTLGKNPFHFQAVKSKGFPLALISPGNSKMVSSTFGEFNYPELWITLHPDDAGARNIAGGDTVRVFNELGEVICRAKLSDRVRDGVVSMPKGAWRKSSTNDFTSTALCPADVNEVGGGACFNDSRVEVKKV